MPLITIVTRHIRQRVDGFERLVKSLLAQTSQDYQHLVIYNEPLGLLDANQSLERHKDEVIGDYVLIVDDDDYISHPGFIARLPEQLEGNPDMVAVRMDFMGKPFPNETQWRWLKQGKSPEHGQISSSNFVIRRGIWWLFISTFGVPDSGDYHFLSHIYNHLGLTIRFWDETIVTVDHIGKEEVKGE